MRGIDHRLFRGDPPKRWANELSGDIVEYCFEVLAEPGHLVHLFEPSLITDGVGDKVSDFKSGIAATLRHEVELSRDVLTVHLEVHVNKVLFDQSVGTWVILEDDHD